MSFKKWAKNKRNVKRIGKAATFYLPSKKLNEVVREMIHDFFVKKYSAYTHESSDIKGYWTSDGNLIRDQHERYEISLGKEDLASLVDFLADLAEHTNEDSIYLTVGHESYLVSPQKNPRIDT